MIPVFFNYQEVIFNWQLDCALLAVAILERWLLIKHIDCPLGQTKKNSCCKRGGCCTKVVLYRSRHCREVALEERWLLRRDDYCRKVTVVERWLL